MHKSQKQQTFTNFRHEEFSNSLRRFSIKIFFFSARLHEDDESERKLCQHSVKILLKLATFLQFFHMLEKMFSRFSHFLAVFPLALSMQPCDGRTQLSRVTKITLEISINLRRIK